MDKAVVLDVFDFVGFHFCKYILNKGYEVKGLSFDGNSDAENMDEKSMEIGRNANFSTHSLLDWTEHFSEQDPITQLFIISIYDLYMLSKDSLSEKKEITDPIIQYFSRMGNRIKLVVFLPIQMYREINVWSPFFEQTKELVSHVQMFYLPTVFGPWQPEVFLFQQMILGRFKQLEIIQSEREWTRDALFVTDAVKTIYDTIQFGKPGSYLLESGQDNYWEECASYLKMDKSTVKKHRDGWQGLDDSIQKVIVKNLTPLSDSITAQIELNERMHNHFRLK
ncbi:hypothetical protein HPT25_13675 [Bacillus sp. BRMEA1]|uniref:hypothetical protein n=1 Tax=Neobacillus endophyticus TaxID=2738405 RepID=UPI001567BC42|nr:hypothetical protein [Neobacillus endophyticus]NRD78417.1 hypothetical protein [Neobacillus endophyticus]